MQVPGREVRPADTPQDNINFNQKIHHLDIELGNGNPGAVGVDHRGAEGATVEDVFVNAAGAFAGFRHAPGSGGAMHGIRVSGGRFGLYLDGTQPSPLISDLRLTGQSEASVYAASRGPMTLVGAVIEGAGIRGHDRPSSFDGAINIVDSVIRIRDGGPAITTPRSIVLDDVWIENAAVAVEAAGAGPVAGNADGWTRVVRYAAGSEVTLSEEFGSKKWRDSVWVERRQRAEPVLDVHQSASAPEAALTEQHRLPPMPGVEELLAASVRQPEWGAVGDGATDDTAAIQNAIDHNDLVFLPKGGFAVSQPLKLRASTRLIGVSNILSTIESAGITGDLADPNNPLPLLDTPDDAGATTTIAMLRFHLDVTNPANYAFRWRAGAGSVVRNIYPSRSLWHPNAPAMNHPLAVVEGNGGGRWYTQTFLGGWSQGPDFRFLKVQGTSQPLRFYHLQFQFGRGNAMCEMDGVRNVDVYAMKSEGDFTLLWLRNSSQVSIYGHNGLNMAAPGWSVIRLENSDEVLLTHLQPMVTRVGHFVGHLVNYDPRRWFILSDPEPVASGLEQLAYYSLGNR